MIASQRNPRPSGRGGCKVTDPTNVPGFMAGITRYEPQGTRDRGKGARFDSLADIAGRKFEAVLE